MLSTDLLEAYLSTVVVDHAGRRWSGQDADLEAVTADTWVITAENPRSRRQDPAANASRNEALAALIRADGYDPVELVGRAPDDSWSEVCFGVVGVHLPDVCAWGREFDQHAVFLLTTHLHLVVDCDSESVLAQRSRLEA